MSLSRIGISLSGRRHLGALSVKGERRLPMPAANSRAVLTCSFLRRQLVVQLVVLFLIPILSAFITAHNSDRSTERSSAALGFLASANQRLTFPTLPPRSS